MRSLLNRLFSVSRYATAIDQDRARMLYGLLLFTISAISVVVFLFPIGTQTLWQAALNGNLVLLVLLVALYGLTGASLYLINRGKLKLAGWLFIGIFYAIVADLGFDSSFDGELAVLACTVIIILGGLIHQTRGLLIVAGLIFVTYFLSFLLIGNPVTNTTISVTIGWLTITGITYLFLRYASLTRQEGALIASEERVKLAEVTTRISRSASQRTSLDQIINKALDQILENYPKMYHAQVFLVDRQGTSAKLAASTGEVGKKLMARAHALAVGSLSVIGQVTFIGEPIIAKAGSGQTVHQRNEFLPDTRVEAAFPLKIGDNIIGALDLQSKEAFDLAKGDVFTFQSLADSLALAIDNVQQFERAEERIQENQRLAEQARNALRQVERLNERLIGRAWSAYLQNTKDRTGLNIDFETNQIEHDEVWTQTLFKALETTTVVHEDGEDKRIVSVPLQVRGQVIGAMEFELDHAHNISPEDLTLVEDVSERFGLAAENARLVQESQRVAQREALVNEIGSRLQVSNNVENTLVEAARSLQETLKVNRISIRLGVPQTNGHTPKPDTSEQWA